MASPSPRASSTALAPLQIAGWRRFGFGPAPIERWLEHERDQLFLWVPVLLGAGVATWMWLAGPPAWTIALLLLVGVGLVAAGMARTGRAARVMAIGAATVATGIVLIWARAEYVAGPRLTRPVIVRFDARVDRVEPLPPRGLVRLRLSPLRIIDTAGRSTVQSLPRFVRVNLATADTPTALSRGAVISLGARLLPPSPPSVPGAYDYARVAWFDTIGATGRGFGPVKVLAPGDRRGGGLRARLSAHIRQQVPGGAGAIAAALATGDQGAMPLADADAMRRSGLAHLLSVSGLHITAVVGAVMLLVVRLLAISPWLALHWRLPLVAAGAGAIAAIGYTLLTGAEVPTVRSCVAALMVLLALSLGRQAISLRLVAAGAIMVLLFWPEALAGPSFQLSFAAVTAIIALHEEPRIASWFAPREESRLRWLGRRLASLLLTGLVVEAALSPISLYHFHKAGLYGSLANIIAIPLTTFVVMPLEALALLLDPIGLGWVFWAPVSAALQFLLAMAHLVANAPGAVAALPAMPDAAFGLIVIGGIWVALWRTGMRFIGIVPIIAGVGWVLLTPAPDILITADGRHVALRVGDDQLALLRDRAGNYTRAMLAENSGIDGEPLVLAALPIARCSRDLCLAERVVNGRRWRLLATRSPYMVAAADLISACQRADIVISDRRLPRGCTPRWLKLDRPALARTGGIAITLATGRVRTVNQPGDRHPWRISAAAIDGNRSLRQSYRRSNPASLP